MKQPEVEIACCHNGDDTEFTIEITTDDMNAPFLYISVGKTKYSALSAAKRNVEKMMKDLDALMEVGK